jgi:hypothetical protein
MAECNPPEPPPLLKEPPHRFPTNEERNEAERQRWEREQQVFWRDSYMSHIVGRGVGCGCLLIIGLSIAFLTLATVYQPWESSSLLTVYSLVTNR